MFASKLELKTKKMKTISINTIKKQMLHINEKALKTTEKVVVSSIDKLSEIQNKTDNYLKKGFEFSEKQQDKFFNTLEQGKKSIWKNLNKALDFIGKK